MPHDTADDALLADPRLAQVSADMSARIAAGRPFRWHRLVHDTLECQMGAGPDLALLTESYWRLKRAGIPVHIVFEWLPST